jgi:hypothetical protein
MDHFEKSFASGRQFSILANIYLSTLEMLPIIFIFVNCSNDQVNHIANY